MTHSSSLVARAYPAIKDIGASTWDMCANPSADQFDPFLSYSFLNALEESGSVGIDAGWLAQHIVLSDADDTVLGVMPAYIKTHSMGEYVFDHSWAHALERAGESYYPKLQCAVPFTPVTGRRLLARTDAGNVNLIERGLIGAAFNLAQSLNLSSVHITFLSEGEWSRLGQHGLLQRTGQQFHWLNAGYACFDEFLGALASRKRKAVRRERAAVAAADVQITHLVGAEIQESDWDTFYNFYIDTGGRKWGMPYLNRDFFSLLGASLGERCLLMLASRGEDPIAGALHMIGGDCLFGRYWGCIEHVPFLHFELCYYQAIEFAISRGLARVEAGAQGDHKLARGYLPAPTYSVHWIKDPGLDAAVGRYLKAERDEMDAIQKALSAHGPYRKCHDDVQPD